MSDITDISLDLELSLQPIILLYWVLISTKYQYKKKQIKIKSKWSVTFFFM